MEVVLLILAAITAGWAMQKAVQRWHEPENDEEPDDFELATVNEKFAIAKQTNDDLHGMEQLLTDLDACSADRQTVVEIRWLGDDDTEHTHDLYCDGMNTATECLREIAEREAHDLRSALAYQCRTLAECTRGGKIGGRNRRKTKGEC